ncbi:preprotein translocase subunit SecE [Patescibacteria group bacterium]|nr:preprotein translocase subunit SecE [Patescibacteria group bacterium]
MGFVNLALNYFRASYRELGKVSWPKREEVIWLTVLVVVIIIIAALFLALVDFGLTSLVTYLLSLSITK